ncbi:MAG: diguanylate cyclase [Spirochaetaceae bacterium]
MEKSLYESFSMDDADVLETLASLGLYISNYITGDFLLSNEWKAIPSNFTPKKDIEESYLSYIHQDDRKRVTDALKNIRLGKLDLFHEIYRLKNSDNSYKWIHSLGKIAKKTEDGKPVIFVGCDFDISDLKEVEQKLRKSIEEERQRSEELETIGEIVKVISSSLELKETVRKILIEISQLIPYETATIQTLKDGYSRPIGAVGFKDNSAILKLKFKYPIKGSMNTYVLQNNRPLLSNDIHRDFPTFSRPGAERPIESWIGIPLISGGEIVGLLTLDGYTKNHFSKRHLELSEIIGDNIAIALENALSHEKAYKMAMEDALTGLGSRHRLQIEGRLLFEAAIRGKNSISVVMIDIDFFKNVNDLYGHDVGDNVLKKLANSFQNDIRETDLLTRYGGEEFLLLMPNTDLDEATVVTERIRKNVELIKHEGIINPITISCGICTGVPKRNDTLGNWVTIADNQLYIAKKSGRNRISVKKC